MISDDLNFASTEFVLIATNVTTGAIKGYSSFTSPSFYIREPQMSTASSSTTTATSTSETTASSASEPPHTTPASQPPTRLSTGAKIGIGAGAGVLAIVLLLGFWACRRRSNSKKRHAPLAVVAHGHRKQEDDEQARGRAREEADGREFFEADGSAVARQHTPRNDHHFELPTENYRRY